MKMKIKYASRVIWMNIISGIIAFAMTAFVAFGAQSFDFETFFAIFVGLVITIWSLGYAIYDHSWSIQPETRINRLLTSL